jgi:ankyrin repeat protein
MKPKTLIICVALAATLLPVIAGEPPTSAEQLLSRFESAIKTKDTNALVALVNCQGVSDQMKSLALPMVADIANHEIAAVTLAPLPETFQLTNEANGIRYRPNVSPIGLINVVFVKEADSAASMQIPYGSRGGAFWIAGTIEEKLSGPSRDQIEAKAKFEEAKASIEAHPELAVRKNEYGQTPLIQAASSGDKDLVAWLLDRGVDVNDRDNAGRTALHWAVDVGRAEILELLLEKRAEVNARNGAGWTPLHEAAAFGKADAAALLLANQADVNARANDGKTPLHLAAFYGFRDVAILLLTHKADINAKDANSQTPLGAAFDTNSLPKYLAVTAVPGKKQVADLLREKGGKE